MLNRYKKSHRMWQRLTSAAVGAAFFVTQTGWADLRREALAPESSFRQEDENIQGSMFAHAVMDFLQNEIDESPVPMTLRDMYKQLKNPNSPMRSGFFLFGLDTDRNVGMINGTVVVHGRGFVVLCRERQVKKRVRGETRMVPRIDFSYVTTPARAALPPVRDEERFHGFARWLLSPQGYAMFMRIDEYYRALENAERFQANKDFVRHRAGKIAAMKGVVKEVYGVGYPFYGNVAVRRRMYDSLIKYAAGSFKNETEFLRHLIPDIDLLVIMEDIRGVDTWKLGLSLGIESDTLLGGMGIVTRDKGLQEEEDELGQAKDQDARNVILLDRSIVRGKPHIDFVSIPFAVWVYAPVLIESQDVQNIYFVKDLLFTCEDLGFDRSSGNIPREFRINYLLRRIASKQWQKRAFLDAVAENVPMGDLVKSFPPARENLVGKLADALREGLRREWFAEDDAGNIAISAKGKAHLAWVRKVRREVMERTLGPQETGYEKLLAKRMARSRSALALKRDAGLTGRGRGISALLLSFGLLLSPLFTSRAWSAVQDSVLRNDITIAKLAPGSIMGGIGIILVLWGGLRGVEMIAGAALRWFQGCFDAVRYPDIGTEVITVGTFGMIGAFFGIMTGGLFVHTLSGFCTVAAAGSGLMTAYALMVYASKGAASSIYGLGYDVFLAIGRHIDAIRQFAGASIQRMSVPAGFIAQALAGLKEKMSAGAAVLPLPAYAQAGVPIGEGISRDGFIRQGTDAPRAFMSQAAVVRKNDITKQVGERIVSIQQAVNRADIPRDLKTDIVKKLKQAKIYGFHSVVRGADDFLLGWYNSAGGALYVAQDVLKALTVPDPADPERAPPPNTLVDEYILHEVLCSIKGHYPAILIQQKIFLQHYEPSGLALQTDDTPYKGLLGEKLRATIDRQAVEQETLAGQRFVPSLVVSPNEDALAEQVARVIADQIKGKPETVLGLATGATPLRTYRALIRIIKEEGIDMSRVKTFNLDEYAGLSPDDERSYHYYMFHNLFRDILYDARENPKGIKRENIHILNGMAPDPEAECRRFEEEIRRAGGIDLQLLGIGENGHIGFNEPGSDINSPTRVVALTPRTRLANARFFNDDMNKVPKEALSMGIGTIRGAKRIVLIASTENKADAFVGAFEGEPTADNPASLLQMHGGVSFMATPVVAAKLALPSAVDALPDLNGAVAAEECVMTSQ